MPMYGSENWARERKFSRTQVNAEIERHNANPDEFFRDQYGDPSGGPENIPGWIVLDWLGY